MKDLDLLHFEQLKTEIQAQYIKNHTPSEEEISKWKGIDIIYFQEDLRKITKSNISEKSFYTYFKTTPLSKLPRIDMLNLLSIYVGYKSWYDFKKKHLFENETLEENEVREEDNKLENSENINNDLPTTNLEEHPKKTIEKETNSRVLQNITNDNQKVIEYLPSQNSPEKLTQKGALKKIKDTLWLWISGILAILVGILAFGDDLFGKTYTYCFIDADRGGPIQSILEIKVLKENESPLFYRIKPGECFVYPTKDTQLKMEISSPFYENLSISRNLINASKEEFIELQPDDYKMALEYFSKKDNNAEQIKLKRSQLDKLISDNAVIYQVFDSDIYGVETINKNNYITLVTTPTTSLKNLKIIEMKRERGKIVSIKFKIDSDEKN